MAEGIVTRDGTLSAESLRDAIADEAARGRRPHVLYVGRPLHSTALGIVRDDGDPLDALRAVMPRVEVSVRLADHEWELRERGEGPRGR